VGSPRSIAVVGLRTVPRTGWRADVVSALAVVRNRPYLWLLGIIGFSMRGGIVLLTLPMMVLPTQVEVRLVLGGNLTSTGLTDGFWLLVAGLTLLTLAAAMVILYVLARVETAAFRQLVRDPRSADHRSQIEPRRLGPHGRRQVATRLYVVQSTALLVILIGALPLAAGISDATYREIVAPSSFDPIHLRVLASVREAILLVIGLVFLVELGAATATRRVLISASGLTRRGTFTRHPVRLIVVALFGWALFFGAMAVGMWAMSLAWQATQAAFLSGGWASQAEQIVAMIGASVVLAAVFGLALVLCGLVSAVRASLWSFASLR
jgi:hypothetical protein